MLFRNSRGQSIASPTHLPPCFSSYHKFAPVIKKTWANFTIVDQTIPPPPLTRPPHLLPK